jgi:hypothetical protein
MEQAKSSIHMRPFSRRSEYQVNSSNADRHQKSPNLTLGKSSFDQAKRNMGFDQPSNEYEKVQSRFRFCESRFVLASIVLRWNNRHNKQREK